MSCRQALLAALALMAPASAMAQPGDSGSLPTPELHAGPGSMPARIAAPPQEPHRLFVGAGLGVGLREDAGFAGTLSAGARVGERLVLLADFSYLASDCLDGCEDRAASILVLGVGARLRLAHRLWVRGTAGLGVLTDDDFGEGDRRQGLGWTSAIGYELIRGPKATADVRFGLIGGFYEHLGPVRATLGVGLSIP